MTIDEMKERKRELGFTNAELARRSGVPLGTVNKLFGGQTRAPRRDTIIAIERVLRGSILDPEKIYSYLSHDDDVKPIMVRQSDPQYQTRTSPVKKVQGEFTLEDYLALPDDLRVELIDGTFYEMAAPHVVHQFIAIQIGYQMMDYVEKKHGRCKPVLSPVDVQLDKDNKTVVQPDVIILCDPDTKLEEGRVFGAPDFVAEILSPSTRKRDMTKKLSKYSEAGVRELWYIDPEKLRVITYDFEGGDYPVIYTFNDSVPVHVWNKQFSVDFTRVYDYVKDYLND